MLHWFSKPPPSATRPPLRVLKPLENLRFPVNGQNAVGAVGAANSGSQRYKSRYSAFSWRSHLDTLAPLGAGLLIVSVLLTIMAARTAHHFDGWRCRPGDVATTNGRELCPAHGAGR